MCNIEKSKFQNHCIVPKEKEFDLTFAQQHNVFVIVQISNFECNSMSHKILTHFSLSPAISLKIKNKLKIFCLKAKIESVIVSSHDVLMIIKQWFELKFLIVGVKKTVQTQFSMIHACN